MNRAPPLTCRFVGSLADVPATAWDACANRTGVPCNPFLSHAFLLALEDSGCATATQGWTPCHLLAETRSGQLAGALPLYLKQHSYGEFVFDQAWARGFEGAGGRYYPKLVAAVPFTPVPGPRLLIHADADRGRTAAALLAAAMHHVRTNRLSSLHVNFIASEQRPLFSDAAWLLREGRQFHFDNAGFGSFDDYLASLNARRRKAVRKERKEAIAAGVSIHRLTGSEVTEAHFDAFFRFYMDTGSRKWGSPYLNRAFFTRLRQAMPEQLLLVLASRDRQPIAGALNLIGDDTLYGRYWGMSEFHPSLHFELCYYQAIEFAIERGLRRIEAGAQGEHKIARGYLPVPTYSAHYFPDPGFRQAVRLFIESEQDHIEQEDAAMDEHSPFRRAERSDRKNEE